MAHDFIYDEPVEFGLEHMVIVRPGLARAEWKFVDDMVDEVDRVC